MEMYLVTLNRSWDASETVMTVEANSLSQAIAQALSNSKVIAVSATRYNGPTHSVVLSPCPYRNDKINVIKAVREAGFSLTGSYWGLKESKDIVDVAFQGTASTIFSGLSMKDAQFVKKQIEDYCDSYAQNPIIGVEIV